MAKSFYAQGEFVSSGEGTDLLLGPSSISARALMMARITAALVTFFASAAEAIFAITLPTTVGRLMIAATGFLPLGKLLKDWSSVSNRPIDHIIKASLIKEETLTFN